MLDWMIGLKYAVAYEVGEREPAHKRINGASHVNNKKSARSRKNVRVPPPLNRGEIENYIAILKVQMHVIFGE